MSRPIPQRLLEPIVVPGVLALIGIGFAGIVLRYAFGGAYALFWSEEVIRYGFIWIFWLTSPMLIWTGATFSVDLLTRVLPQGAQRVVAVLGNCAVMALLAIYLYQGAIMTQLNWRQLSTALEIPMGWAYLAIPIGSGLMMIATAWTTLGLLGVVRWSPPKLQRQP